MKLTIKNTKGKDVKIRDAMGRHIPHVFEYDTKTKRARLFLYAKVDGSNNSSVVTARSSKGVGYAIKANLILPGSYAEIDGKKVK